MANGSGLKPTGCRFCDKRFLAGREDGCKNHEWRTRRMYAPIVPEKIEPINFAESWIAEKLLAAAAEYLRRHPAYKPNRVLSEIATWPERHQMWAAYNFEQASRNITSGIHKAQKYASLCRNEHI